MALVILIDHLKEQVVNMKRYQMIGIPEERDIQNMIQAYRSGGGNDPKPYIIGNGELKPLKMTVM